MTDINPGTVTKPMQLLAAWLAGLILVDSAFLVAAAKMDAHSVEQLLLILAAILNVPLFLGALFVLQTRFRPELQEDTYYSKYLDAKTNKVVTVSHSQRTDVEIAALRQEMSLLASKVIVADTPGVGATPSRLGRVWSIGINNHLDNFDEIREKMRERDIPVADIFGAPDTDEKPKRKIISMREELDFESKRELIQLGSEFGIEAYNYLTSDEGPTIPEAVLIGSYGFTNQGTLSVPITKALIALLDGADAADLKAYETRHRVQLT